MNKRRKEQLENGRNRVSMENTIYSAVEVYRKLPQGDVKNQLFNAIVGYMEYNGFTRETSKGEEMAPEYKMIIRDDCYGDIAAVPQEYLSTYYRHAADYSNGYSPEQYHQALMNSKKWQEMREFAAYKAIEKKMISCLGKQKISPSVVNSMNISDFRDFARTFCLKEFMAYREKENFVKTFINEREQQFDDMLRGNGVNGHYVDALLESMKTKGIAWDIEATDKNGYKVEGPEFDRHHTHPVSFRADGISISQTNLYDNLDLMEKNFHKYLHLLERKFFKDGAFYFEKIITPSQAACILNFETMVKHDFSNPEERFMSPKQKCANPIYLNKIEQLTGAAKKLIPNQPSSENNGTYRNKQGRGKARDRK